MIFNMRGSQSEAFNSQLPRRRNESQRVMYTMVKLIDLLKPQRVILKDPIANEARETLQLHDLPFIANQTRTP